MPFLGCPVVPSTTVIMDLPFGVPLATAMSDVMLTFDVSFSEPLSTVMR